MRLPVVEWEEVDRSRDTTTGSYKLPVMRSVKLGRAGSLVPIVADWAKASLVFRVLDISHCRSLFC
jgi:hypothetical protein